MNNHISPADQFIKDFDEAMESWWKRVEDQIKRKKNEIFNSTTFNY